jgi:N4-gp56 family major capsid protein
MASQTFSGSFSSDAVTYIAEKTLMIAKKDLVFHQLGDKAVLPNGNSKTFQYTRYDRLNLPLSSLSEGVTPSSTSVSISTASATAEQWGAFVDLSDVVELTVKHPVMQKAIDLMGYQAGELIEREIIKVLLAGTNIRYMASDITSRADAQFTSADVLTTSVVRAAVAALRNSGAHEYDGKNFVGVVDPSVEMDLNADTTFQNAGSYSNIKVLLNGEIGMWMGVRWMRSNNIPTLTQVTAESYTSPASPAGTFTTANYRVTTAYYSASTGHLVKLSDNADVAFTNLDSLAGTTPNDSAYKFKIFVSAAAGAASATMYQGVDATAGTDFIAHNTAFSVLAPPSSGDSISGADIPTSANVVHFSWIIGKEAFTVIDLQKLQTFVTPAQASDSDPLVQRRKAGWKLMFKALITNQNYLVRLESASAY